MEGEKMGLNKTNGNMYPWVTHTWNPLAGQCQHDCHYCYMKRSFLGNLKKYKGNVKLNNEELDIDLGSGNTIFVGSATDVFGEWVPDEVIKKILTFCRKFPNTYLFQSKNPARFKDFIGLLPKNSIIATTLETNRDYNISKAPSPNERYKDFRSVKYNRKMISIEPILDFDLDEFLTWIKNISPEFVSIGADSKNNNLKEPNPDKIKKLIQEIKVNTKVKIKKNLDRVIINSNSN
jgi:DNA repair photolyase